MNDPDHALPQQGGSFIRQADGSLVPADAVQDEPALDADKPALATPRGKTATAEKE